VEEMKEIESSIKEYSYTGYVLLIIGLIIIISAIYYIGLETIPLCFGVFLIILAIPLIVWSNLLKEKKQHLEYRSSIPVRCPQCGTVNPGNTITCNNCQKALKTVEIIEISKRKAIALYAVSLILPLAGLIISAIYYYREEPEYKRLGGRCALFALLGFFLLCHLPRRCLGKGFIAE